MTPAACSRKRSGERAGERAPYRIRSRVPPASAGGICTRTPIRRRRAFPVRSGVRSGVRPGIRLGIVALPLALTVAGCAGTRRAPASAPGAARVGAVESGEASWYGIEERGNPTANGEPMDPGAMTAAHRTLPFGTVVEVTDRETGASIRVRINDRGPFRAGRIIDLSHEAARRLGIVARGVAPVTVTVVERAPESVFSVQVGAYRAESGAAALAERLRAAGFPARVSPRAAGVHRVRVGRYGSRAEADRIRRELRSLGHEALVVQLR